MRRAFDASPSEPDDIVRARICRTITRDGIGLLSGDAGSRAVDAMVDAVLTAGSAGELDGLVQNDLYDRGFRTMTDVCDLVYDRACGPGWPKVADAHVLLKLREATDDLVDWVVVRARSEHRPD